MTLDNINLDEELKNSDSRGGGPRNGDVSSDGSMNSNSVSSDSKSSDSRLEWLNQELSKIEGPTTQPENGELKQFIKSCNAKYPAFEMTARWAQSGRPTMIEVRLSMARYRQFYSPRRWTGLESGIRRLSKGTLVMATDEEMYLSGVIDIAVSSWNAAYREHVVVLTLKWLVEQLLGE